jgi:hypothetical protein
VLDVVTGGVLDRQCMQRDDEWRDTFVDLQGDSHHAIADVGGVTNDTLLFTGDHLDPVPDLDRSLSVSIPYRSEKRKIRNVFGQNEWADVQRRIGNDDARGRKVLDDETRFVSLVVQPVILFRELVNPLAPHCLHFSGSPLAQLRVVMMPTFSFSFLTLFLIFMTHDDSRRTHRP